LDDVATCLPLLFIIFAGAMKIKRDLPTE